MSDVHSVSRITRYLRDLLATDPFLSDVWLRGEISNWTQARSGHCYFTLKDEESEIRCVMWRDAAQRVAVLPRNGDEVVAAGSVGIYAERGSYQFYVYELQPLGLGVLFQRFEALKAALAAEGLFAETLKRPLPTFPQRIGIVTSPTAAALQDMLNVLRRRQPLVQVLLSPTLVQGHDAPPGIVRALRRFERVAVDLVIVARGGGSLEDLWPFNDESVARAIRACSVPVISGVGHEVDFTIADFVADRRAPTPSAAAELAVPDARELQERLALTRRALHDAMHEQLAQRRRQLGQEQRALERLAPEGRLHEQWQRLDELAARLDRAWDSGGQLQHSRLAGLVGRLANLDPRATIARGYAIVAAAESGRLLRRVQQAHAGQRLRITVEDGEFGATVAPQGAGE